MLKLTFGSFAVVAIGLLLMLTASPAAFTSYDSVCLYCHQAGYTTPEKAPHADTKCVACHRDRGLAGATAFNLSMFSMASSFLRGGYDTPLKAEVRNANCLACHEEVETKTVVAKEIRIRHADFLAQGYRCTFCHNTLAHWKVVRRKNLPEMDKCSVCHDGEIAAKDCVTCHTTERSKRAGGAEPTVYSITHGEKRLSTHGMGDLKTCDACHGSEFCVRCHQLELPHPADFPGVHGQKFLEAGAQCMKCHQKSFCDGCHQTSMPHYPGFLPAHGEIVRKEGGRYCLDCHLREGCLNCHEKHTHKPEPGLTPPKKSGE